MRVAAVRRLASRLVRVGERVAAVRRLASRLVRVGERVAAVRRLAPVNGSQPGERVAAVRRSDNKGPIFYVNGSQPSDVRTVNGSPPVLGRGCQRGRPPTAVCR